MSKKPKLLITAGVKGFFDRAHAHARKLDRGEEPARKSRFHSKASPTCCAFFPPSEFVCCV